MFAVRLQDISGRVRMIFSAPSRALLGFRHEVISATRGNATVNTAFSKYEAVDLSSYVGVRKSKLVSCDTGKTTGYALMTVEERGQLFVGVGEEVYEVH